MNKLYMGLDVGTVSTKGVLIDKYDNIIASSYLYTEGDPMDATKKVIRELKRNINLEKYQVVSIGVTGSARKLVGAMLDADTIRNEITANAVGTIKLYPSVKTIFEIGGQDSKIIIINDGLVTDYAMNTSCASGMGLFLDSLAKRLNIRVGDIANLAFGSKNKVDITSRCIVFAESDLIDKMQMGYRKEDVLAGVCFSIANNYINSVTKGKKIQTPIVFNGGVSKNMAIVRSLEKFIGEKIIVNNNSHLMGALGIAIMTRESGKENIFNFNVEENIFETKMDYCGGCANNCGIVAIYRNNQLVDYWGNRCEKGMIKKSNSVV